MFYYFKFKFNFKIFIYTGERAERSWPEVMKPRWAWGILVVTGVGIMGELDKESDEGDERGTEVAEGTETTEATEGTETTVLGI